MKRPPPSSDDLGPGVPGPSGTGSRPSGSKKRRRPSFSEDEDSRPAANKDFGKARFYNSACRKEKPDELFRKDLISAMKLPDNEQLDGDVYWELIDSWKPEWEKGVQVPVNSDNVLNANVRPRREPENKKFKLPNKLMRTTEEGFFSSELHVVTDAGAKAELVCKYDLDDPDVAWLKRFNELRIDWGLTEIKEELMEKILEDFETQCSKRFQDALKAEKGLGIEYDENILCDVCKNPDIEDFNEMVFCDVCNICVHQACYGIVAVPEGSWVCKTCSMNVKPPCVLCPNMGGAMKETDTKDKWAHVSCALWIIEVIFGDAEKMEPIMKIASIPSSRWSLKCCICREKAGASIQCSVKQCKTAYHVTCGLENGLIFEMNPAVESSEQGVKMQSFCEKHGVGKKSPPKEGEKSPPKKARKTNTKMKKKEIKTKDIIANEVEQHNARLDLIRSLEGKFHLFVVKKDTQDRYQLDKDLVDFFYYYWVLKRRTRFNKPLLIAKCADEFMKHHEMFMHRRLKMFVHLRQDLERVRNLCYMLGRREKTKRMLMRAMRDIVEKQIKILRNKSLKLTPNDRKEVIKARFGSHILERFYCSDVDEEADDDATIKAKLPNPYAKSYVNNVHTRSRRRTTSQNAGDPLIIENCDSESNEMPTLVKCKSEENLSSVEVNDKREPPPFTNTCEVKQEIEDVGNEPPAESRQERKQSVDGKDKKHKNSLAQETNNNVEPKEPEMPKINTENLNTRTRKHSSANGSSGDKKNSVWPSDKENINALNSVKTKKTRTQVEGKLQKSIHELAHPKLDLLEDEINPIEISSLDIQKNYSNTRYPTRNRRCSSDILLSGEAPVKLPDPPVETKAKLSPPKLDSTFSSPKNNGCNGEITFLGAFSSSPDNEQPGGSGDGQLGTPKRGRGRPRKIRSTEVSPSEVSLTVIKEEMMDTDSEENLPCNVPLLDDNAPCNGISPNDTCNGISPNDPCNGIPSSEIPYDPFLFSDSSFRMSLRHPREIPTPPKKRKIIRRKTISRKPSAKRRKIQVKSEPPEPLQEETDTNGSLSPPRAPIEPANPDHSSLSTPERLVMRFKRMCQGANRELWKTDSSSSESFQINPSSNDNSMSDEFPSALKFSRAHFERFHHRYPMRERTGNKSTS